MRSTTLLLSAAMTLCSTSVFAQSSYNVVVEPVAQSVESIIHAPLEYDDNGVVKAQHFNVDNLTDEEYQRVVDEANRIRTYRDANGMNFEDQYVYADTASTTDYETGSSYQYETAPSYQVELFAPETSTSYAATTSAAKTHTVSKGDTLFNISKRYDTSVQSIQAENGMSDTTLSIGQRIRIPGVIVESVNTAFSDPIYASSPSSDSYVTRRVVEPAPSFASPQVENVGSSEAIYAVLPKDTLYSISRRTCTGVNDIISRNGIADPNALKPGQRITLPAGHCLYR